MNVDKIIGRNESLVLVFVVFFGLLITGCDDSDKDRKITKQQDQISNLVSEKSSLVLKLDTKNDEIGNLKRNEGKGELAAAEKLWPKFIIILFILVVGFVFYIRSMTKKHNESTEKTDSEIEKLKQMNNESTKTINQLINDIERLKQLNEEGERNQVVTQIKESLSRRENIIKKIGGLNDDKSI